MRKLEVFNNDRSQVLVFKMPDKVNIRVDTYGSYFMTLSADSILNLSTEWSWVWLDELKNEPQ